MKTRYCCNDKLYENYYLSQVGRGSPYFAGGDFQKGYGLGNIFSSIGRAVLPLFKSGAKALGKEALKSGTAIAADVLEGRKFKDAASVRAKQMGSNLLRRVTTFPEAAAPAKKRKKKKIPKLQKRKRVKHSDIFS